MEWNGPHEVRERKKSANLVLFSTLTFSLDFFSIPSHDAIRFKKSQPVGVITAFFFVTPDVRPGPGYCQLHCFGTGERLRRGVGE